MTGVLLRILAGLLWLAEPVLRIAGYADAEQPLHDLLTLLQELVRRLLTLLSSTIVTS